MLRHFKGDRELTTSKMAKAARELCQRNGISIERVAEKHRVADAAPVTSSSIPRHLGSGQVMTQNSSELCSGIALSCGSSTDTTQDLNSLLTSVFEPVSSSTTHH
ncbi:hypothetical protein OGCDGJMD_00825 [Cyanobium usitatum str. Tous]|nr:hypothetical protein OGCDGJMD_00825 [Cyanobium usitatum str. Tous]